MNRQRKQRLLGTLLLVSLAVIFLPLILDGSGYRERQLEVTIPPAPEIAEVEMASPRNQPLPDTSEFAEPRPQPVVSDNADAASKTTTANTRSAGGETGKPVAKSSEADISGKPAGKTARAAVKKTAENPPSKALSIATEKPVLDKQGVPVAWTIQLASFRDAGNARALRKKLSDRGYKSYIRRKDQLSKVFVGPDIQRTELEKLRAQLKREFRLDGLILRFTTG